MAVQAASYKLVLDRMVGQYHLHKNVAIVCAGNLETDNAIVNPLSTALQSRLVHMELIIDVPEWLNWASSSHIDHRITSYINFKPGNLYTFNPDHSDKTYACPRTWAFSSKVLNITDINSKDALPMLAGTISEGVAREFVGYCKAFKDLPTIQQIVASPTTLSIPEEPSVLFALTGAIGHNATKDNFADLMKYVERLPMEFQVVCLKEIMRRNKELIGHPAAQKWISTISVDFF